MDVAALDGLMKVISNPASRRSFSQDAEGTLQAAGVDLEAIPQSLLDTFSEMTVQELRMVANLNQALVEAGFQCDDAGGGLGIV